MSIRILYLTIIPFLTAFVTVCFAHPTFLKLARRYSAYDEPGSRKLQKNSVPVMGGIAVFMGIVAGMFTSVIVLDCSPLFIYMMAATLLLYIGLIDDLTGLSASFRLIAESLVIMVVIYFAHIVINDVDGLWGIDIVPLWLSVPLTVVACVGIINAINLIDGVDGLSTGYAILSCALFGWLFFKSGDILMLVLAVVMMGALIPFFLHNVFGLKTKMYIGDSGALVIGIMLAFFAVRTLQHGTPASDCVDPDLSAVAVALAILSEPVFDAVRVVLMRIFRGRPPFSPDNLHLHHAFIRCHFSHAGTTACILVLNSFVVAVWWLSYKLGASQGTQVYIVVAMGLLITWGCYALLERARSGFVYRFILRLSVRSHWNRRNGLLEKVQRLVDKL